MRIMSGVRRFESVLSPEELEDVRLTRDPRVPVLEAPEEQFAVEPALTNPALPPLVPVTALWLESVTSFVPVEFGSHLHMQLPICRWRSRSSGSSRRSGTPPGCWVPRSCPGVGLAGEGVTRGPLASSPGARLGAPSVPRRNALAERP